MVLKAICLGDPVIDLLAKVDEGALRALGISEGGCVSLEESAFKALIGSIEPIQPMKRTGGGSAANVAKGLANLLGHRGHVSFVGRIGSDEAGRAFEEELRDQRVHSMVCRADAEDTAACLCMVTASGQRTMRTCLAAAAGLKSADQLPRNCLHGCNLLHMEGYVLYRPDLARQVAQSAKSEGCLVSLDLSSFELIQHCQEALLELLKAGCIDVIACNEEEAAAVARDLAGRPAAGASIEEAQSFLLQFCQVNVVSLGAAGCLVQGRGQLQVRCMAPLAVVSDTVGAGDCFLSGFLYGMITGMSLKECGDIGCLVGSTSVAHEGATLSMPAWEQVRAKIHSTG